MINISDRRAKRCWLVPFQSPERQTGRRPQTVHSFWGQTLPDKLPKMSGYSSGTGTKNKKREKLALLVRACLLKWGSWFRFGVTFEPLQGTSIVGKRNGCSNMGSYWFVQIDQPEGTEQKRLVGRFAVSFTSWTCCCFSLWCLSDQHLEMRKCNFTKGEIQLLPLLRITLLRDTLFQQKLG